MEWWEWGLTVVTGGAYAAGKALYNGYKKVTGIADDVENAAEQVGVTIAKIGDTVVKLGDDLDSLIEDIDDLLVIERLVPRSESDLWDEEKKRLSDLVERRKVLKSQIDTLREEIKTETGVDIPASYGVALQKWIIENVITGPMSWFFGGSNTIWRDLGESGRTKVFKIFGINSEVIEIEREIHEILYNEPGILPTIIYNAKEVIERFNTIEQPKIEDILDSVDDNLVESKEILEQVKKLFVIKERVPVDEGALSEEMLGKLKVLQDESSLLESVISKDWQVAKQLMELRSKIQPTPLKMPVTKSMMAREMRSAEALLNRPSPDNLAGNPTAMMNDLGILKDELGDIGPNVLKAAKQPNILKTMVSFSNSRYYAYNNRYAFQKALIRQHERDLARIKSRIDKIKYKEIENPGVIPRILASFEGILGRIKTEEQPRIEAILDSVNENLIESKEAINKANAALGGMLDFVNSHKLLVKIALAVAGGATVLILILIPILLIRLIIFGL